MAFDYTKKANYHYVDLGDIDESLLNHPLYPYRSGKEKNALYFVDKAFLYEAFHSRSNILKGLIIDTAPFGAELTKLTTNALTKWDSITEVSNLCVLENDTFPDTSILYDSMSAAREVLATVYPPYLSFGLALSLERIEEAYEELKSTYDSHHFLLWYSPISFQYAEYENVYLSGSTDRRSATKIAYNYYANWSDSYDGEWYTQIKNELYSISAIEPASSCITYKIYGIFCFTGWDVSKNRDATYYAFVELCPDGPTLTQNVINKGKSIFQRVTANTGMTFQYFSAFCSETYLIMKSLVDISI